MALRITTRSDAAPITVRDSNQLDEVLSGAGEEARKCKVLAGVLIEADNGNTITMVVGGNETVLSFDHGHRNPPYYASKGASDADAPIMTCLLTFQHHTEFRRKYVISVDDGAKAVRQFLDSGELPTCIKWEEV
jgi:hypothetical protein